MYSEMKKIFQIGSVSKLLFIIVLVQALIPITTYAQRGVFPSLGGSRSGTSGFQFLKINVDARAAGMANSNVADVTDASSLYSNPALAAQMSSSQLYASHTAYFVDISMNYLSYVQKFQNVALGGSMMYLNSLRRLMITSAL